jgi:hypothetical protein
MSSLDATIIIPITSCYIYISLNTCTLVINSFRFTRQRLQLGSRKLILNKTLVRERLLLIMSKPGYAISICSIELKSSLTKISYRKNSYKNFGQNSYRKNSLNFVRNRNFVRNKNFVRNSYRNFSYKKFSSLQKFKANVSASGLGYYFLPTD